MVNWIYTKDDLPRLKRQLNRPLLVTYVRGNRRKGKKIVDTAIYKGNGKWKFSWAKLSSARDERVIAWAEFPKAAIKQEKVK